MKKAIHQSLLLLLCLLLVLGILLPFPAAVYGAVQRPSAQEIPPGTLLIGTHLIHIRSVTGEILAVAANSAQNSMQEATYYKSEFAGNTWFDISSATSFAEISSAGRPVSNSVIDSLALTHWTREDGITIDLNTGNPVLVHQIENPGDLRLLPELNELKVHRDLLLETINNDNTRENRDKLGSLNRILLDPFSSPELGLAEQTLNRLEGYLAHLRAKPAAEDWILTCSDLKESFLTTRKLLAYQEASARLNQEILFIDNQLRDEDHNRVTATDLSAAYYACLDGINQQIAQLEGELLPVAPASALEETGQEEESRLLNAVAASDYPTADRHLERLMAVNHIQAGLKIDIPLELSLLYPLFQQESQAFLTRSTAGVAEPYPSLAAAGESETLLRSIMNQQAGQLTAQLAEVQSLLEYIQEREGDLAQLGRTVDTFTKEVLSALPQIPGDALQENAANLLKQALFWSNDLLARLQGENLEEELLNELNSLDRQIDSLMLDYLTQLDNRNLTLAQALRGEIDSLAAQRALISQSSASEARGLLEQKTALEAQLDQALQAGDNGLAEELVKQLASVTQTLQDKNLLLDGQSAAGDGALQALFDQFLAALGDKNFPAAYGLLQEMKAALEIWPEAYPAAVPLLTNALAQVEALEKAAGEQNRTADRENLARIGADLASFLNLAASQTGVQIDEALMKGALLGLLDDLLAELGMDADSPLGVLYRIVALHHLKQLPEYAPLQDWMTALQEELLPRLSRSYLPENLLSVQGRPYISLKELAALTGHRYVQSPQQDTLSLIKGKTMLLFKKDQPTFSLNGKEQPLDGPLSYRNGAYYVSLDFAAKTLNYVWIGGGTQPRFVFYPAAIDHALRTLLGR